MPTKLCSAIIALFAAGAAALCPSAQAQQPVQKWEGGVRFGFAMPFQTLPGTRPTLTFGEIVAEGRFNFPNTPFDLGLAIGKYPKAFTFDPPSGPGQPPQKQDMVLVAVVSDYNFTRAKY